MRIGPALRRDPASAFTETEVRKELAAELTPKATRITPRHRLFVLPRSVFRPAHPYGHPPDEMTYGKIGARTSWTITRSSTAEKTCDRGDGDFDINAAKRTGASFRRCSAGSASRGEGARLARRGQMLLIDKPDATQTYFEIAQPASTTKTRIGHAGGDQHAVRRAVHFDAERRAARQFRIDLWSQCATGAEPTPGAIVISTYTKTDSTVQAIDMALDVLKRLTRKGLRRSNSRRPRPT